MPEDRKRFELGDYVEVKDRIKILYELYGQARLVTEEVTLTSEPDGKPRVMVKALAYRTPDDPHPGVGYSWLELPGKTPYTNGSELENAETSAWGRAIASLGILIDRSIASAQEVDNKAEGDVPTAKPEAPFPVNGETEALVGHVKRRGVIRKGTAELYKLKARQTPDGHAIGFRLEIGGDKAIPQCLVKGPLGEALYMAVGMKPETLVGMSATVSGLLYNVKRSDKPASWYRLHVDAIETDEWILPAPPEEAPTVPLFDPDEEALIGAAVEAAGKP